MSEAVKQLQMGLLGLGFNPGLVDGIEGQKTLAAARAYVEARSGGQAAAPDLPWMVEMRSVFGLHEVRDKARLQAWLKSDGKTLGDPSALPWCADAVATAIAKALPDEPMPGALGANPYWARNWTMLGKPVTPTYGAILVFSREGGGHVGFAVGEDNDSFFVLGGNQGDSVSVVRIHKSRLVGCRWPDTFKHVHKPLPRMSAAGIPQSVNEF